MLKLSCWQDVAKKGSRSDSIPPKKLLLSRPIIVTVNDICAYIEFHRDFADEPCLNNAFGLDLLAGTI